MTIITVVLTAVFFTTINIAAALIVGVVVPAVVVLHVDMCCTLEDKQSFRMEMLFFPKCQSSWPCHLPGQG